MTEVEIHAVGTCPECGAVVGTSPPGAKRQFVVHATPTCEEFDSRDPLDFLAWVNAENRKKLS